jgi:hypothetical protein
LARYSGILLSSICQWRDPTGQEGTKMGDTEVPGQAPADDEQQSVVAGANQEADPAEKPSTPDAGSAEPIAKPDEKAQG